ncbi:MAG: hypothetical protein GXO25_01265 [Euryarchaeota archaeon]|nr:hypothetical protein [Euryarchaeota archaeon]
MGIKLVPLKCPKCGSVVKGSGKDMVFRCENCGEFIYAPTGATIPGKIYDFEVDSKDKAYMPFFTYLTKVQIYREEVKGLLAQHGKSGEWLSYIPAWAELPAEEIVRIGKLLTSNPPDRPHEIDSFRGVSALPVGITIEEGEKLAEFLFLSYEVEMRGTLQRIDYSFEASFRELVYMPMNYRGYYVPAFRKYTG